MSLQNAASKARGAAAHLAKTTSRAKCLAMAGVLLPVEDTPSGPAVALPALGGSTRLQAALAAAAARVDARMHQPWSRKSLVSGSFQLTAPQAELL